MAGDFNGDGRLDLATANSLDGTVSVLLGNGDGTFQPQVTYAEGSDAIVAGDFNGDGRLDLAVANYKDNDVSVLLGNGDGTFQPQVTYAVGSDPFAIVAGDFNGDGRLDLAVADPYDPGGVSVLLGNGDGTFQPAVQYAVGSNPFSIVAVDFNGDGHLDLAVATTIRHRTSAAKSRCCWATATGHSNPRSSTRSGRSQKPSWRETSPALAASTWPLPTCSATQCRCCWATAMARSSPRSATRSRRQNSDRHRGGRLHRRRQARPGRRTTSNLVVSVLLGNGDGTFQPAVQYAAGSYPYFIVAGDFNGDGRLDLAVANYGGTGTVSVLLGNGDGTFVDAGQFVTTPHATPLVADVNGDGTDDLLVVDGAGDILYRQGIPGQPGTFEPPVTVNPNNPSRDIAWLPNTDQGPMLASVDAQDDAISLYAYRDGGFVRIGSLTTGQLPAQIIAADLNGTGWTDLVVRNAGDGTLSIFFGKTFIGPVHPIRESLRSPDFPAAGDPIRRRGRL